MAAALLRVSAARFADVLRDVPDPLFFLDEADDPLRFFCAMKWPPPLWSRRRSGAVSLREPV